MTVGLIALAVIVLALLWLLRDKDRRHVQQLEVAEARWYEERKELLTRIQRPEYVPAPTAAFKQPEPPKDAQELAAVGTVLPFSDEEPVDASG